MANRARNIAGPIIRAGFKRAAEDYARSVADRPGHLGPNEYLHHMSPQPIIHALRIALVDAEIHPAVIEDWCNEPVRRIDLARIRVERHDRSGLVTRQHKFARYGKIYRRRRAARIAQRAHRIANKIGGAVKKLIRKVTFRATSRKQ